MMGIILTLVLSIQSFAESIPSASAKCKIHLDRVVPWVSSVKQVQNARDNYESIAKEVHHYRRKVGYLGKSIPTAMEGEATEIGAGLLHAINIHKAALLNAINSGQKLINDDPGMDKRKYDDFIFKIATYTDIYFKYTVLENTIEQLLHFSDPLHNKETKSIGKH